jgi:hypothetical protein
MYENSTSNSSKKNLIIKKGRRIKMWYDPSEVLHSIHNVLIRV